MPSTGGFEAVIDIATGDTLFGRLPKRARALVAEWHSLHIAVAPRELGACPPGKASEEKRAMGVDKMDYHVIETEYVSGFILKLKFRDGTVGEIDLEPELTGPVFGPLREPELFRQFCIDPEFHTLVWPNGADLAPEFLYERARVSA